MLHVDNMHFLEFSSLRWHYWHYSGVHVENRMTRGLPSMAPSYPSPTAWHRMQVRKLFYELLKLRTAG